VTGWVSPDFVVGDNGQDGLLGALADRGLRGGLAVLDAAARKHPARDAVAAAADQDPEWRGHDRHTAALSRPGPRTGLARWTGAEVERFRERGDVGRHGGGVRGICGLTEATATVIKDAYPALNSC
jgi:hypothetical protein